MIRKMLGVVTLALTFLAGAVLGPVAVNAITDTPTTQRGCVFRFDTLSASGKSVVPRIYENSAHVCIGITSIRADWTTGSMYGDLIVTATEFMPVSTITVGSDETLGPRGIQCFPTGGPLTIRLRCYDRDGVKVPAQSLKMYGPGSNLWFGETMAG